MASPPPTPGKSKWSSRMGGALRRSSTLLSIARPSTPGSDKGSDSGSLRRSTSKSSLTSPPVAPAVQVSSPSPIAESPIREAASMQQEAIGPSPLAQQTATTEPEAAAAGEATAAAPEATLAPAPTTVDEATSPIGYIPPPVIDTSVGNPGAFTDEPEALPQTELVADPYAATNTGRSTAPSVKETEPKSDSAPGLAPQTLQAPPMEQSASYFDKPMAESMKSSDSLEHPGGFAEAIEEHAAIPAVVAAEPDYEHGEAAAYYRGDPSMPIAEPHRVEEPESEDHHELHAPAPVLGAAVMPSYGLPAYSNQEVWGGVSPDHVDVEHKPLDLWTGSTGRAPEEGQTSYGGAVPIPIPIPIAASVSGNGHAASYHSHASSMKMPNPHPETQDDPFADPVVPIMITHSEMPHIHHPDVSEPHRQAPIETHEDSHGTILMPLPAFQDVVASESIQRSASNQSFVGSSMRPTDERIPLLARPITPNKYLNISQAPSNNGYPSISPLAGTSSANGYGATQPRLIELGWVEYILPDGTIYYYHMTNKIVTDLNLRSERVLGAVNIWMEGKENESTGVDLEGWLREANVGKKGGKSGGGWGRKAKQEPMVLERYWVDHHHRSVVREDVEERKFIGYGRNHAYSNGHGHSHSHSGKGKKVLVAMKVEEDQLDLEYRYWTYMEAHPAHLPVSHTAKADALDVLNWAWTDRLLPSHRAIPAPFTQEECRELRPLLQSFDRESEHGDRGIQTRIISRILLRVAQWRQMYFRPNKALPKDVDANATPLPIQRRPIRRALFDFLIGCVFLGIPYLFFERARLSGSRPSDEESGSLLRGSSPMLIIGACTCLVAAIVLSASVTFLSLPGLDSVARTAGMVAVLFAAFAMAATGVAVLRHKADLERPVPHVGVEGIMVISRRTIALSLPLVFLAYSIIGFVVAISLYSFRGVSLDDPRLTKNSFEDYTRWTVVGVLGALAGMVTTSLLVLRR